MDDIAMTFFTDRVPDRERLGFLSHHGCWPAFLVLLWRHVTNNDLPVLLAVLYVNGGNRPPIGSEGLKMNVVCLTERCVPVLRVDSNRMAALVSNAGRMFFRWIVADSYLTV